MATMTENDSQQVDPNNKSRLPFCYWRRRYGTALMCLVVLLAFGILFTTKQQVVLLKHTSNRQPLKILYIVTSLAEYNSGMRATTRGSDRLQETVIPVIQEGVLSMVDEPFWYNVDVFLICHWKVQPERLDLIRKALPPGVGLDYWDEATPTGYALESASKDVAANITRALARQHRFVIKEKLLDYDLFVAFEDDMLVKGDHVHHYVQVTKEIDRLYQEAPPEGAVVNASAKEQESKFSGDMTKEQLLRTMPGFIRVEVLLEEKKYGAQRDTGPIPVDLKFRGANNRTIDPGVCCHVRSATEKMPAKPRHHKVFLWETGVKALGVRKMPEGSFLNWVMMQRGPNINKLEKAEIIGEYWAGRDGALGNEKRPNPTVGPFINNQGGWMGTRKQIWNWHTRVCPGGFLPPYEPPDYNYDGLDLRNVEYWSGGMHLFTARHACNLQRIVLLQPDMFSRHLIYHTANNKQRQLSAKREERFVKANTLLGQLNSIKKRAQKVLAESAR